MVGADRLPGVAMLLHRPGQQPGGNVRVDARLEQSRRLHVVEAKLLEVDGIDLAQANVDATVLVANDDPRPIA